MLPALILAAAALLLAGAARAETTAERAAALAAHVTVVTPPGPGPFPTVLQFHGCGGRKPLQDDWAAAFRDAGFAAIVVDSFAPRGIGTREAYATVCTGLRLRGDRRAGDVFAAVAWARAQPFVDPGRIALIGWSHGGWTVLDALALPAADLAAATGLEDLSGEPLADLAGVVALYPYVGVAARAARAPFRAPAPPVLAYIATADRVVGWRAPKAALARQGAELRLLDGATHAFDEADARDLRARYDPALTAAVQAETVAWLGARFAR